MEAAMRLMRIMPSRHSETNLCSFRSFVWPRLRSPLSTQSSSPGFHLSLSIYEGNIDEWMGGGEGNAGEGWVAGEGNADEGWVAGEDNAGEGAIKLLLHRPMLLLHSMQLRITLNASLGRSSRMFKVRGDILRAGDTLVVLGVLHRVTHPMGYQSKPSPDL
ncbi:hypothetical protein GQ457_HM001910 [Hibiscus cannabinus]